MPKKQKANDGLKTPSGEMANAEETRALQADIPTENDLDYAIRRAVAKLHAQASEEDSKESLFLARMADVKFYKQHAAKLREQQSSSQFPDSITNFTPIEALGSGGMGQVFKVRHDLLGQIQAIKVLHAFRVPSEQAISRFRNEMRAIGALKHPNIVAAQHADFADGIPYLVMDYVEGETLSEILAQHINQDKTVPIHKACDWIRQVAVGIQYAHEKGIVHRDIKPGNVIIDQQGTAKVLDLGLARIVDDDIEHSRDLTADQQVLGTPSYMAPEQLTSSRNVDARADVYSLAATLYRLLTGAHVHPADKDATFFELATKIANDPVPDVRTLRPEVESGLADLISGCLQKDPEHRVQSAAELAVSLEHGTTPRTASAPVESDAVKPEPKSLGKKNSKRSWLVLLACLLPLILLAGFVIRISLPGGGELIIESDSPDAKISVVASQEDGSRAKQIEVDGKGSVELHEGEWKIKITGLDADEYRLSKNNVVISKGKKELIRVYKNRREVAEATEKTTEFAVNDNATYERLPGYVKFPAGSEPTPEWQIIPNFVSSRGTEMVELSPKGTYLVACNDRTNDPYTRILNCKTGRMVGMFFRNSRYERYVCWAPDESMFAIHCHDWNQVTTVVCRPDGTELSRWTDDLEQWPQVPSWSPDGKSILFVGKTKAQLRTIQGDVIPEFKAPKYPEGQFNAHGIRYAANPFWSPDGSKFAFIVGGQLHVYNKDGGDAAKVISTDGLNIESFLWHPDSEQLLTNDSVRENEQYAYRIWGEKGEKARFGLSRLHERVVSFTHNGSSLLTNYGSFRNLQGEIQKSLKYKKGASGDARASNESDTVNLATMSVRHISADKLLVHDRTHGFGLMTEFDSSGNELASTHIPAPVKESQTPWEQLYARKPTGVPSQIKFDDGACFELSSDGSFSVKTEPTANGNGSADLMAQPNEFEQFDHYFTFVVRNQDGRIAPLTNEEFVKTR